jgi:hypothetical protein
MGLREKELLYRMIFMKLYKEKSICPRGTSYAKYLYRLMHLDEIAIARTNYVLASIGESYERETFGGM